MVAQEQEMTFVDQAPLGDESWSKDAAARASETARVSELLSRLLADLASLDSPRQARLDYLEPAALDAVRSDPDTYQLIGRAASSLEEAGDRCLTTAYWSEPDSGEVDVELVLAESDVVWGPALAPVGGTIVSHRLRATVDRRHGRIERLEVGD